jgi:CelD/BcsL family acetyltransferase involved in cellulose biosynthesis
MTGLELVETVGAPAGLRAAASVAARHLAVEVVEDLGAVEDLWRALQDEAVCSPYQRFDWVRSYVDALAAEEGFLPRIVVVRSEAGRPLLILPLALCRRFGATVASFLGGRQANFNLPIMAPGLAQGMQPSELKRVLHEAGRALGADVFTFLSLPLAWRGEPNPLVTFGGPASANDGFKLSLSANPDQTLARAFRGETRKKMRKKLRLLAELGEVRSWRAETADKAETILAAFFQQKARRFRHMGIENPFKASVQTFIRQASLAGVAEGHPAIELHALSLGERIIATFGGTGDRWRFCGMFNSFDTSEDVMRFSPGELLLSDVIRHQCGVGRQVFDLGVGEARYKTSLCDEVEELIDVFLPLTLRGRAFATASEHAVAAKRFVKHTPWAMRTTAMLRGLKAATFS